MFNKMQIDVVGRNEEEEKSENSFVSENESEDEETAIDSHF